MRSGMVMRGVSQGFSEIGLQEVGSSGQVGSL